MERIYSERVWIVKIICRNHNHELVDTLIGYSYVEILKSNEHSMVVDMTKSLVKLWKRIMGTMWLLENKCTISSIHIRDHKKDEELKCTG